MDVFDDENPVRDQSSLSDDGDDAEDDVDDVGEIDERRCLLLR